MKKIFFNKKRNFTFKLKDESGQLLIEMLVAVTVGGILLAGATIATLSVVRHNYETRGAQVGTNIASELMSKVVAFSESDWNNIYQLNKSSSSPYYLVTTASGTVAVSGQESVLYNDPQAGLVAHWKFDEVSGVSAYDYSSNANAGSVNGALRMPDTNCRAGGCLSFNGTSDYVLVPDSNSLDVSGNFTLSAWVKWNQFKNYGVIAQKNSGGGTNSINYGLWSYDTNIIGYIGNGTTGNSVSVNYTTAGISTGNWYLISFVSDGVNLKLYINGQLVSSASQTIAPAGNAYPFYISDPTYSINGLIDDVRIYSRAITQEEIDSLYKSEVYYRYFYTNNVNRDINGNISDSGTDDPATQKVTTIANWQGGRKVEFSQYITRKEPYTFFQTDWSGGQLTGPATTTLVTYDVTSNIATSTDLQLATTTTDGNLISTIFDTQQVSGVSLNYLMWHGTQPSGTTVKFQLASSNQSNGGFAGGATGPIDPNYRYAWNDSVGWFDFGNGTVNVNVADVSGYATNTNIGEIALNCASTPAGNMCATSNFKVERNNTSGDLFGWAWNDRIGWISFNCLELGSCSPINYKVNVSPITGDFTGYAWNDAVGWISFNCADPFPGTCPINYKVRTQGSGGWNYIGPDGTSSTYYTMTSSVLMPVSSQYHNNHRYIRYKVFMTPNGTSTPVLDDVVIGMIK